MHFKGHVSAMKKLLFYVQCFLIKLKWQCRFEMKYICIWFKIFHLQVYNKGENSTKIRFKYRFLWQMSYCLLCNGMSVD